MPILDFLYTARPTAVNLGAATRRLTKKLQGSIDAGQDALAIAQDLVAEGHKIADEDVGRNKEMSKFGGEWLIDQIKANGGSGEKLNILTVCNTGSLATSVRMPWRVKWRQFTPNCNTGLWDRPRADHLFA